MENELIDEVTSTTQEAEREKAREELLRRSQRGKSPGSDPSLAPIPSRTPGPQQKSTLQDVADTAGAIGKDVGKGVTEAPVAVASGVTRATREVLEFGEEAGAWIGDMTGFNPALNLKDPMQSGLIINKADDKHKDLPGLEAAVPDVRRPESVTGGFIEGAAQFMAPLGAASKATQSIKVTSRFGKLVKFTGMGAAVDFTAFDPYEDRLSDLLAELPTGAARPFFEWMATEDSALEGRIKNAIEGGVLGASFDGLYELGRGVVAMRKARARALEAGHMKTPDVEGASEAARRQEIEGTLLEDVRRYLGEQQAKPDDARPSAEDIAAQVAERASKAAERTQAQPKSETSSASQSDPNVERRLDELVGPPDKGPVGIGDYEDVRAIYEGQFRDAGMVAGKDYDEIDVHGLTMGHLRQQGYQGYVDEDFGAGWFDKFDSQIDGGYRPKTPGSAKQPFGTAQGQAKAQTALTWLRGGKANKAQNFLNRLVGMKLDDDDWTTIGVQLFGRNGPGNMADIVKGIQGQIDEMRASGVTKPDDAKPTPVSNRVQAIMDEATPDEAARARTFVERGIDEVEAMPATKAREYAEQLTGRAYRTKKDAIEGVRKFQNKKAEMTDAPTVGEGKPYINTRMINGPEDLQATIRNLADRYKSDADVGVRTSDAVIADARDIRDFEELSKTRPERLTDAEQYAVREMWASSARQVRNLAEQAAVTTDPVVQYAFRRAVVMHRSIQQYAFEARAAAARSLRQWAIPVGETPDMLRTMETTLDTMGGAEAGQALADKIAKAYRAGNRGEAEQLVKKGWFTKSIDMLNEIGVAAKLYQPSTHLVNMGGNALLAGWEIMNRAVAGQIGRLTKTGVEVGEATAMMRGRMLGFRDALREARHTLRTGEGYGGAGKVELPRESAFHPNRLEMKEGSLGAGAMKFIAAGVSAPFRALGAADTFFKVQSERAELYAQAMRASMKEARTPEEAGQVFARYIEEPTREMQEAALKAAQEQTFTTPARGLTKNLMDMRGKLGPLGYITFPFIQTPANILSYGIRSTPMAPFMRSFREQWAAGGPQRELAIARIGTGTTMLALAYDMAANNEITGGGPPPGHPTRSAWLRTNRPYSLKMGDRTIEYRRADPFGLWLGTAADMYEMFSLVDWDEDVQKEADELFVAAGFSLGNTMMNKTWMTGMSDIIEALADPQRYSDSYVQRVLTGFIPSGIKTASRVDDPMARETEDIFEAFRAHFGFSEGLPLKRDWLGREIDRSSGLGPAYDFISPISVQPDRSQPIDREILRLGWGPSKPQKRIVLEGASISLRNRLDLYSRYLELSGQVKRNGRTLNEALNDMVSGKGSEGAQYARLSDGPDGQKRIAIEKMVQAYRQVAKGQLVQENRDWFMSEVERRQAKRAEQAAEQRRERLESRTVDSRAFAVPE